ncbi:hypothetical protein [Streptomyces violascens]|uniref:hypothetical protein n=1 Tax=Streptomyces violascens TaxID=67381 RepID=UPI00368A7E55
MPLWVSYVELGSVHDLAAMRLHALPHLYQAASGYLPFADIGYPDASAGVQALFRKGADLPGDPGTGNTCHNRLLRAVHFPGARAMAVLRQRRHSLRNVTVNPNRIAAIPQEALTSTTPGNHER